MSNPSHPQPLSPERLTEIEALRNHVRNNLLPAVSASAQHHVRYFRLGCLLDESAELQTEVSRLTTENETLSRRLPPEEVAAETRELLKELADCYGTESYAVTLTTEIFTRLGLTL